MLTKADLIARIQARLAGRCSDEQLANWAFERFYACELGAEMLDPADGAALGAALDDLMFALDDPSFALDAEGLQALIKRLEQR